MMNSMDSDSTDFYYKDSESKDSNTTKFNSTDSDSTEFNSTDSDTTEFDPSDSDSKDFDSSHIYHLTSLTPKISSLVLILALIKSTYLSFTFYSKIMHFEL